MDWPASSLEHGRGFQEYTGRMVASPGQGDGCSSGVVTLTPPPSPEALPRCRSFDDSLLEFWRFFIGVLATLCVFWRFFAGVLTIICRNLVILSRFWQFFLGVLAMFFFGGEVFRLLKNIVLVVLMGFCLALFFLNVPVMFPVVRLFY